MMNDHTSVDDPSTAWRSIRVTSSTAIQTLVTTSLLHLSDPTSNPIILHTLPSPSNASTSTSSISIIPKNSHAGLSKLISIVEILKREFEPHQKEEWRLQDEKERKKLDRKLAKGKGKKRAREDEVDAEAEQVRQDASVGPDNDNVASALTPTDEGASKTAKKQSDKGKKKKARPLLRIYQYNILDAYERLPGATSLAEAEGEEEAGSDASEDHELSDNADGDEQEENTKIASDLIKSKLKAAKSLDEAIKNHVVRARRRPRKKHTPYMKIILSTKRLPEYEAYLKSSSSGEKGKRGSDYTIQLPVKKKSRTRGGTSRKRKENKETGKKEDQGQHAVGSENIIGAQAGPSAGDKASTDVPEENLAERPEKEKIVQEANSVTNKKRKANAMDSQSSEATQVSSQITHSGA